MLPTHQDLPNLWNDLGLVKKKLGDFSGAAEAYQKSLELQANYPEVENNWGMLELAKSDKLGAALHFRRAIEMDANYADPHFNLAVLLEEEGNWRSAIEEYKLFLDNAKGIDSSLRRRVIQRIEEITP